MSKSIEPVKNGRPERMQEKELDKLKEAFAFGCTDIEAINYMNLALGYFGKNPITERTFYDYQDRHPEFSQEKEALKNNPVLMAQKNIVDALTLTQSVDDDGNKVPLSYSEIQSKLEMSKWYLSRKKKEDFGVTALQINNNIDKRSISVIKDDPRVFKTLTKAYQAMIQNAKDITADEQRTE